jgi:hypothetical protein
MSIYSPLWANEEIAVVFPHDSNMDLTYTLGEIVKSVPHLWSMLNFIFNFERG